MSDSYHTESDINEKYKVWFFAGGETRDDKFNVFTGSYIRLMKKILQNDFEFIKGIYFKYPMMNVLWALNNSQKPIAGHDDNKIFMTAFSQILNAGLAARNSTDNHILQFRKCGSCTDRLLSG